MGSSRQPRCGGPSGQELSRIGRRQPRSSEAGARRCGPWFYRFCGSPLSMPTPIPPSSIAYLDESFLTSDAARPLRILAEYLQPLEAFRREQIKDTIVFFGSARLREEGALGRYYEEARALARLISE